MNDGNIDKVTVERQVFAGFLDDLPASFLRDESFTKTIEESPLIKTADWAVALKFGELTKWQNKVLVACLEPADGAEIKEDNGKRGPHDIDGKPIDIDVEVSGHIHGKKAKKAKDRKVGQGIDEEVPSNGARKEVGDVEKGLCQGDPDHVGVDGLFEVRSQPSEESQKGKGHQSKGGPKAQGGR